MPGATDEKLNPAINMLADKIDAVLQTLPRRPAELPNYIKANPQVERILMAANAVIGDPKEMHTEKGMMPPP